MTTDAPVDAVITLESTYRGQPLYAKTPDGRYDRAHWIGTSATLWDLDYRIYLPALDQSDPEVIAIAAEKERLDRRWQEIHADLLEAESARHDRMARAAALEDLPARPDLLVCLECGATYAEPGHVEDGGMGCRRCNGH